MRETYRHTVISQGFTCFGSLARPPSACARFTFREAFGAFGATASTGTAGAAAKAMRSLAVIRIQVTGPSHDA